MFSHKNKGILNSALLCGISKLIKTRQIVTLEFVWDFKIDKNKTDCDIRISEVFINNGNAQPYQTACTSNFENPILKLNQESLKLYLL